MRWICISSRDSDLGGGSLREGVERRAISAGASRAYVVDARETFVRDFGWPRLQANARYQGVYPLATALARPLHRAAARRGRPEGGRRRGRPRLHRQGQRPGPLRRRGPRAGPGPRGRRADARRAWASRASRRSTTPAARGIELPITKASPYSIDVNLWGRSCETGVLEDPWVAPPADVYAWTVDAGRRARPGGGRDRLRGRRPGRAGRRAAASRSTLVERLNDARRRPRGRPDRPRRGPPGRHQEPRDLRGAGGDRPPRARTARSRAWRSARTRCASTASWPTSWPSSPTTACGSAPCTATCAATSRARQRVVSGEVRVRLDHGSAVVTGRRSPALAVREEPGHVRRGRRVRPRVRRRVHRDLRPAAPHRGRPPRRRGHAPRRGLDLDRPAPRRPADDRRRGARRGLTMP